MKLWTRSGIEKRAYYLNFRTTLASPFDALPILTINVQAVREAHLNDP